MATSITWPPIGGASFSIPAAGEVGWPSLSNFLIALQNAQSTESQKIAIRTATTTPVTVASATDCVVRVELSVPGPSSVVLPAGVNGQYFVIVDGLGDASTNNITITANGAETINGQSSLVIDQDYGAYALCFRSSNWTVVGAFGATGAGSVPRSDIAAGQPDYVVINNNLGELSEEQYLSQSRGGMGANVSAFTGVVKASAGSFSASTIVDADIDANAGIDATKIADGSVTDTEFQYLGGVTSDIQTQINACATTTDLTNHINDTTTHGTTGNIVGDTDTQTLSNKTLTNPVFTGTGSTPSYTEAMMWYDTTDDVIRYYNDISGDSVAVGQELIVKVRNQTGSSIPAGSVVYCNGSTGTVPTIALARANSFATSRVFGVTPVSIANNTTGYVTFSGLIRNIDTSAFSSGDQLFLSATTPGALTATRPVAPNFAEPVATVARSNPSDGRLIVEISNAIKLGLGAANQILGMNSGGTGEEYISSTGTGNVVRATGATLVTPLIDDAADFEQIATPSNPAAGRSKIYPKSDGFFYTLDSSGTEVQIGSGGSGTGTLNIVDNPSAVSNTTGWTAATNYTVSRDTSNSPLAGVIDSCFAISTTTASSESSTSGVYAASLAMPAALRNTKTQVSIYANIPASSLGVWRMSVYNASGTRMSLSSDSSSVTTLPAGFNGQFVCTFDADSSATYTIGFTQTTRTSANTLYVTNISIGNGITAQGAAISEWQSYTPTWTSLAVNNGTSTGRYRRVGSNMEIQAFITWGSGTALSGTLGIDLPSGFTLGTVTGAGQAVGTARIRDAGTATYIGTVNTATTSAVSTNIATVALYNNANDVNATTPFTFGTGDAVSVWLTVPISEWAGNGTVNLGQGAQVEYASNSTAFGTSNSSAFQYGPAGAGPTASAAALFTQRVRFQYPIQSDDLLQLEFSTDRQKWFPAQGFNDGSGNAFVPAYDSTGSGSSSAGAFLVPVSGSNTDVDVQFFRYINLANDDSPATNWPTTWYWRVRKAKASAPVGFGLAGTDGSAGLYKAGQAPGYTGALAIASGYLGEQITSTFTSTSVPATATRGDFTTLTMTAGTFDVYANVMLNRNGATFSATYLQMSVITASGNSGTGEVAGTNLFFQDAVLPTNFTTGYMAIGPIRVICDGTNITVAGTTTAGLTLRLKGYVSAFTVATPQVTGIFKAVRVA